MTTLLLLGRVVLIGDYNINLISTPESWTVFSKADAFRSIYDAKTTSEHYKKFFGEPEQIDFEASIEFRDETTITCSGRRFSVLWTAQEGGAICILAGARASFLSRKTNGAHILTVDAYTDGIIIRFQAAEY